MPRTSSDGLDIPLIGSLSSSGSPWCRRIGRYHRDSFPNGGSPRPHIVVRSEILTAENLRDLNRDGCFGLSELESVFSPVCFPTTASILSALTLVNHPCSLQ